MENIINGNGFVIKNIEPEFLNKIKKELTITPFSTFGNGNLIPATFNVYMLINKDCVIPIYYGISLKRDYIVNFKENIQRMVNFDKCNIILRENQIECFNICKKEKEKKFGGGIINLTTGSGKTMLALKIASYFGYKTLVIVNKVDLIFQWKNEISKNLPDVKVGIIQGSKFEHSDCDIVIGMLQTISMRKNLTYNSFEMFDVAFIDECHTIGSEVFSTIMFKVRPKYLFGLTATLERKDKCEKIIKWYIGDILYSNISNEKKQNTEVHIQFYTGISSKCETLRDGTALVSKMISNIANDKIRSDILITKIKELLSNDTNRYILVLSDRVAQLKYLHLKLGNTVSGLFIGSMKQDELMITKTKKVILGTYGVCNQGFNHPILNCLIFATPRSSITQAIGRIFRKEHFIKPIIVDIVDKFSIFTGQHYRRKKIYKDSIDNCVFKTLNLHITNKIEDEIFFESENEKVLGDFSFLGDSSESE